MTAVFPGDHDARIQNLGEGRPRRGVPARLLRLASDERLVEHVRAGSEAAFEALFDRHHRGVLGFCRHMLGSVEEAEDAVQHAFLSAYRELVGTDKHVQLRPWLYTIARNRCLTMLRGRSRVVGAEDLDPPTEHLAAEVERRHDLRDLLRDVAGLPEDQRAALVLSELGDMSHDEIADVLGCRRDKVKALVFQARSSLIASRAARDTPCAEIREQLANLHGGSLRRNELRRHVNECGGCREFREQVRAQRRDLALVLPVAPTVGLKSAVLGGGSAAAIAGGGGGGVATGAVAAKVIVAVALAGGGTVAVETTRHHKPSPRVAPAVTAPRSAAPTTVHSAAPTTAPAVAPRPESRGDGAPSAAVKHGKRPKAKRDHAAKLVPPGHAAKPLPPGQAKREEAGKPVPPGHAKHEAKPVPPDHAKPDKAATPEKAKPPKAAQPGKANRKAAKPPKAAKPVKAPRPAKAPKAPKAAKAPKPPKALKLEKAPKPTQPAEAPTAAPPASVAAPAPGDAAKPGKSPK